jgi:hypothetical protein
LSAIDRGLIHVGVNVARYSKKRILCVSPNGWPRASQQRRLYTAAAAGCAVTEPEGP